jgi:hypothetical protein
MKKTIKPKKGGTKTIPSPEKETKNEAKKC